jgi:hypothetical protein
MALINGNKPSTQSNRNIQNNMALFSLHSNKEIKKEF